MLLILIKEPRSLYIKTFLLLTGFTGWKIQSLPFRAKGEKNGNLIFVILKETFLAFSGL
jgi:hypothetical protein